MRNIARITLPLALAALVTACTSAPPRGPCTEGGPGAPLDSVCGFENPEDIEYVEGSEIVVVSNMRFDGRDPTGLTRGGYLATLVPATGEVRRIWPASDAQDDGARPLLGDPVCAAPPAGAFYPHGLTSAVRDGATLVYVVAHQGEAGGREAVEIFEVTRADTATRLRWRGCVPMPPGTSGNDAAVTPDGEIVVSNYQPSMSLWYTIKANVLGMNTGDVRAWLPGRGWRSVPRTDARQANGIAVSRDGSTFFYSETATGEVHRARRVDGGALASVDVGGNPDGLAWSGRGTLLVATHTGGAALLPCALGRAPCRTSWEIHEIDPATLAVRLLLAHDGDLVGAVSAPLVIGNRLYLASIYDDRIGVAALPER